MKKLFSVMACLLVCTLFSQTSFYYHKGKKQELQIDRQKINVFVSPNFQSTQLTGLPTNTYKAKSAPNQKWGTISFTTDVPVLSFYQALSKLKSTTAIEGVGLYYKSKNGESVGTSNLFYVKLKQTADYSILVAEAAKKKLTIERSVASDGIWYCLKTSAATPENTVELSNYFFETGKFADVDPGFVLYFTNGALPSTTPTTSNIQTACINDSQFYTQWGLNSTANPAIDINACNAWQLATGVGSKVAVIDSGIKLSHPDIASNIFSQSYDSDTQTQPSQPSPDPFNPGYFANHGTHVAGIIGAKGNNGFGIAGVAYNCSLIAVSSKLRPSDEFFNDSELRAGGIYWAAFIQQADIINCSWYSNADFSSTLLEDTIIDAIEHGRNNKGALVVFSSGNNDIEIKYPAYIDPRIMVVGASTNTGQRAAFSCYIPNINYRSNEIDVVAPGVDINSLLYNVIPGDNFTVDPSNGGTSTYQSGTSMAAPHVSGVAALLIEVNPCLSGQQIRDIIEQTAQKVGGYDYQTYSHKPNGTWNQEMGYGLLDAHAAVLLAQQLSSNSLDLYIKDTAEDLGIEPNASTVVWNSPDIWVRNQNDGIESHQTPEYNASTPNYVYVKVRNKSCAATSANTKVSLYYNKPNMGTGPGSVVGSSAFRSSVVGSNGSQLELIGDVNVPVLNSGQETVLTFVWNMPDPKSFSCTDNFFDTFLIAKVVDSSDPNQVPETSNNFNNIRNNNNIAGKSIIPMNLNTLVAGTSDNPTESSILIANPYNEARSFRIELMSDATEKGKPIYNEAEVTLEMDENLKTAWINGGTTASNIENTKLDSKKKVANNNVVINNILLNANQTAEIKINFSFLTAELTNKEQFNYHFVQIDNTTNQIVGAVTFEIKKPIRPAFEAEADNSESDKNEPIVINAKDINEPAEYKWYDSEGNLVFEGKDLQIASAVAQKYKLEVIATADGFKDYKEVEVKLKPSTLERITPNPAVTNATVSYKINKGNSAYLMIIGYYGSNAISSNYILDINSSEININVINYPPGFYTVALVVDGEIVDAKTMIKE